VVVHSILKQIAAAGFAKIRRQRNTDCYSLFSSALFFPHTDHALSTKIFDQDTIQH